MIVDDCNYNNLYLHQREHSCLIIIIGIIISLLSFYLFWKLIVVQIE